MSFWKKLFTFKKVKKVEEEDWEQIVYARDNVDFEDEEQRSRYITNCLEQIKEASAELDSLNGEYAMVTSYLTDMEEIESLPKKDKEEIEKSAVKLGTLEKERNKYRERKQLMDDFEFHQIKRQEAEIPEGIEKIVEAEKYDKLIKQDLQRLSGEKNAFEYRENELNMMMNNYRGMAIIALVSLFVCVVILLVLQFGFEMDTYLGFIAAVAFAALAIVGLALKFTQCDKEILRVKKSINRIIQLQNTVKIRYVNNTNLLDYLYIKYNTDDSAKLEKKWKKYQQEKEIRKQYAENEAKLDYYGKQLVDTLLNYRVKDPYRWIHQAEALINPKEMVEIRHELILRRQALRKQMEYNNDLARVAKNEILQVAEQYPRFASEIMEMVDKYETAEM